MPAAQEIGYALDQRAMDVDWPIFQASLKDDMPELDVSVGLTLAPRTAVIKRIVSGGQTGADRAALDWAIAHGVPHGGWCPQGRIAEDGIIPAQYQVTELAGGGYRQRTKANVRDSDGTLIVSIEPELTGGSRQTLIFARQLAKPWLHLHPCMDWRSALRAWIDTNNVATLNVAGPRASSAPAIGSFTFQVLDATLSDGFGAPDG